MGWLGASGIGHYDLCDNNVLIDIPSREVRLVDFEMSTGNSCAGFLRYA
jgi:thiamine kinase-like enzyme